MLIRNLDQLKRIQQRMLAEYRERRSPVGEAGPTQTAPGGAPLCIGRVNAVVGADVQWGAHLLVVKQIFGGTPPAPSDLLPEEKVFYPTPGRSVADFAVDEHVLLIRTDGASLAAKLP